MPSSSRTALDLVQEWRGVSPRIRVLLVLYLAIGAWGGISGGFLLAHEIRHPLSYAVSFLVLEPVGICCLLALVALVALVAPESSLSSHLGVALGRARIAVVLVALTFALWLVAVVLWVAWEWFRLQR
jgi:hypothetical protein